MSEDKTEKVDAVEVKDLEPSETVVETEPKREAEKPKAKQSAPGAAVSGNATDAVYLSRCVFKNPAARKSLTVHHIQRRLAELGYVDAATDKDGWYGDLTALAVRQFQADNKLEGDGMMNADTFTAIFKGDTNVTVSLEG